MGIILSAKCNCGFEQELRADRGKIVSGPTCYAPALCNECNNLNSLNFAKKKLKCKDCGGTVVYYNEKTLQKANMKAELISWGMDIKEDFILPKADFKCPKCGEFSLKFMEVGYWD